MTIKNMAGYTYSNKDVNFFEIRVQYEGALGTSQYKVEEIPEEVHQFAKAHKYLVPCYSYDSSSSPTGSVVCWCLYDKFEEVQRLTSSVDVTYYPKPLDKSF